MSYLSAQEIESGFANISYSLLNYHQPDWWDEITAVTFPNPIRIEFNEDMRGNMPIAVKNGKGIYMFFVEPNHPFQPDIKHLMYIGSVISATTERTFFKRFYDYVGAIGDRTKRKNYQKLTNLWPGRTWVYYYVLDDWDDADIEEREKLLFNKIVPPLNVKLEGAALRTRQFYN